MVYSKGAEGCFFVLYLHCQISYLSLGWGEGGIAVPISDSFLESDRNLSCSSCRLCPAGFVTLARAWACVYGLGDSGTHSKKMHDLSEELHCTIAWGERRMRIVMRGLSLPLQRVLCDGGETFS